MQTEKLIFYQSCEWKVVEEFSKAFPNVGVTIFTTALIVETINLCDLSGFVITSKNSDSIFEAYLQGE
jgi:hypothetical protein